MTSDDPSIDDDAGREEPDSEELTDSDVDSSPESTGVIDRAVTGLLAQWRPLLLAASVTAALGLVVTLFFTRYLPDRKIDEAAAQRVVHAASDGAVAALSYSSDSLDRDFTKARSHLTGDFLAYYDKFTKDFVVPAVQKKQLTQTVTVVRAAVSELQPDSAVVLIFLNETTVSKDKPQPLITPSGVRATVTKVGDSWLISKLDPVV